MKTQYNPLRHEFRFELQWEQWFSLPMNVKECIWRESGYVAGTPDAWFVFYLK